MTKIQILWVLGLNIASYLIVKVVEKIISESPELPQMLLQYFDVNLYYALFVAEIFKRNEMEYDAEFDCWFRKDKKNQDTLYPHP